MALKDERIDNKLIFEKDLLSRYRSCIDPRLNPTQAKQIMQLVKNKWLDVRSN